MNYRRNRYNYILHKDLNTQSYNNYKRLEVQEVHQPLVITAVVMEVTHLSMDHLAAAVVVVLKVKVVSKAVQKAASRAVLSHVSTIAKVSRSSHVKTTLMPVKAAHAATLAKVRLVATSVVAKTLVNLRAPVVLTIVLPHVVHAPRLRQVVRLLTRHHVQLASLLAALTPRNAHLSHALLVNK